MKKAFIYSTGAAALVLFIATGALFWFGRISEDGIRCGRGQARVAVGKGIVCADVARTPRERQRGLSGREPLEWNEGMLFVFEEPRPLVFWMKDMRFPLDMIWVREGKVIGVSENVPLFENGIVAQRRSPGAADRVLEVRAGWARANGVRTGDALTWEE